MGSLSGLDTRKLGTELTSSFFLEDHGKFSQLEFMLSCSDSGLKTMPKVLPN